ncbi:Udp-glycosyltransferase 91a1 [Thalictrum thalictroides]|uniref:Udp-glycosyltransferase 91a1 n=1 Tax=Thalictrum thalictroides TaxID=46969 RepID=A0A7J6WFC1_THATH|nr:Udp-glycosyltransferase 91a1 [Thalictrum thalictroides]
MAMAMARASSKSLHVVMLPWLAFGHMIPFYQLSIALAKAGIRVSYISTPKNIARLPIIPTNLQPLFKFVEFRLPVIDGLPKGAEATADLSMEETELLKKAYDMLDTEFKNFVSVESVDWIIQDVIAYWVVDIAKEFGIRQIWFSVFCSVVFAFLGHPNKQRFSWQSLTSAPEWMTFPSTVAFKSFEAKPFFSGIYCENASVMSDIERLAKIVQGCQAIASKSCREYEGRYLDVFQMAYAKPVIPVGILPPVTPEKKKETSEGEIFKWLDQQKNKSVVYVGFGSEVKLSREQVSEIAHGLELAKLPFLWALRKPMWAANDDDALPSGFRSQTRDIGMVILGWVPQLDILAHPSVGGSLFHSGWGSIIETLQHGHTLVVLPFVFDQGLNARLLVEKGLAVEVDRTDDGKFNGEDIAKALRFAMLNEEGESVRARAREMKPLFSDQKLHYGHYISEFVQYLKA